jgi:two-component system CheB/CheR fusion protein
MLETLQLGVLVLSPDDTIVQNNSSILALYGLPPKNLSGKRLPDTDLFARMPDLDIQLQASRLNNETSRFQNRVKVGGEEHLLQMTLRPLLDHRGTRSGTLVYCEDVTVQEKLQTAVEELESTSEELQSANEELETTNEELQSTNEELETTNEELQSLNEELETTNQELEERGKDLDQINSLYAQTLEKIRLPVMLVNSERHIEFWNTMALQLFGFRSKPPIEFRLEQLPLAESLRNQIVRRVRSVLLKQQPVITRNIELPGRLYPLVDIHYTVVEREDRGSDVLIMYEPHGGNPKVSSSQPGNSSRKVKAVKPTVRKKKR